jgi:hypothetical protein
MKFIFDSQSPLSKVQRLSHRPQLMGGKGNRIYGLIFMGLLIIMVSGCAERRIEDAFNGNFKPSKNNFIINEYCKSCHIHKNFDPADHVRSVRADYKRPYFRRARQCRACHYIEKNWVTNNYHRKTRNPRQANRGSYKDFEHAEIKQMKKNAKKR